MSEAIAPPPPAHDRRPPSRRLWLWLFLVVAIPISVLVTVVGFVLFVAHWQPRSNLSGAMLPTLVVDDFFLVDRDAFIDGRKPRRGDVVTFVPPDEAGIYTGGGKVELVKRIIGLPGEQVEMRKGVPVIDGRAATQELVGELSVMTSGSGRRAERRRERFADGTTFEILKFVGTGDGRWDEGGPFTVPRGSYFVLGDNRDDSIDSRSGLKLRWWFLPAGNLVGRVNYIYWSGVERFSRIGMAVK